ncbi:MAG: hypothetical protein JWR16_1299 [Nevskia sp.]|nr:hypothetical protein [Nevskia sp.]
MRTIIVKHTIQAPIEQVFDLIADHARYDQFPGVRKSTLIRNGKPSKNGVGAIREIDAGKAWFREEITAYQRPTRMDYQIVRSFPPLQHRGASVQLKKVGNATEVTWTSTVRLKVPLIGDLLTPLLASQLAKSFKRVLQAIGRRLAV